MMGMKQKKMKKMAALLLSAMIFTGSVTGGYDVIRAAEQEDGEVIVIAPDTSEPEQTDQADDEIIEKPEETGETGPSEEEETEIEDIEIEEEEPEEEESDPRVACAKIRENEDGSRDMGNLWVEMDSVTLYNKEGQESHSFRIGDDITVAVKYHRNNEEIKDSAMGIHIYRNDGTDCYGTNTLIDKMDNLVLADKGEVRIKLRDVHLLRGRYEVEIAFHDDTGITYNHRFQAAYFEMLSTRNEVGSFRIDHQWLL